MDAQAATVQRDRVATDRHRARSREELLDAVLAHDELPVGIERTLRPWWRDHVAFDLDPEWYPFGVRTTPAAPPRPAICSSTDVTRPGRRTETPPAERLHADEPQRPGTEDPRTPLLVCDGMGWLVGVRQQHRPPGTRGSTWPSAWSPRWLRPLDRHTRQTDLALVVPDPHRRALSVRRHGGRLRRYLVGGTRPARQSGRSPCAVPVSSGPFSVQYRRDLGVVAGRPGNNRHWPRRSRARRLAGRPRATPRRGRRRPARRCEPIDDRGGRREPADDPPAHRAVVCRP